MQQIGRPIAALLVAMVSIQIGASFAKKLFPLIGPEGTTALRLSFATAILFAVWRPWRYPLNRGQVRTLVLYGISLGGMNFLFYSAIQKIPLGIGVALEFTGPLSLALLHSRRALDFLWALLAAAGLALVLPLPSSTSALSSAGIALALAAGACWALYIFFGQRAGASLHSGSAAAYGMLAGTILVFPVGAAHAGLSLFSPAVLPLALVVAVLSSAVPYSLEMVALKRLPTKTFGILMSLEPAIAALMGRIFLGERLTALQCGAIACIIAASAGASFTSRSG